MSGHHRKFDITLSHCCAFWAEDKPHFGQKINRQTPATLTFLNPHQNEILKGTKHYLVITQNNCWHKNLLGNKQWRAHDSKTKTAETAPSAEVTLFLRKKVIYHSIIKRQQA